MKDMSLDKRVATSIAPAALAADNTPVSLERLGYQSLTYFIHVGVGGITFDATNKVEFTMTHSDDGTTWTAVEDDDVKITLPDGTAGTVGTGGIVRSLVAAHAAATVTKVGYIGHKKYTRLLADFSGTHGAATPMSAMAEFENGLIRPV